MRVHVMSVVLWNGAHPYRSKPSLPIAGLFILPLWYSGVMKKRLYTFWNRFEALWVFFILLIFSFGLQFSFPDLVGVDGFYHIGMADELRLNGIVGADGYFPYLQYTTLRDTFANQHFLYHVLLVPFTFFDLILGAKIAAAFFAGLAFFSFYVLLKVLKVRHAWIYALLLPLVAEGFLFRMILPRAPAVSLAGTLLLFAVYFKNLFLRENAWLWRLVLFFVSGALVWLYGGFVLYLVLMLSGAGLSVLYYLFSRKAGAKYVYVPAFVSALGMIFGVVSHPHFPNILVYLQQQLFETGAFASVAVGGEWLPYGPMSLLANTYVAMIVFLLVVLLLFASVFAYVLSKFRSIDSPKLFLWLKKLSLHEMIVLVHLSVFSAITFVLQISARRYVEYFVPFSFLLFSFVSYLVLRELHSFGISQKMRMFLKSLCVGFVAWVVFAGSGNVYFVHVDAHAHVSKRRVPAMLDLTDFTRENIPEGEVIVNVAWDTFPLLFMNDRKHYYAWGLDPTFLYVYSPELYEQFKKIWGSKRGDVAQILRDDFNAEYLFVDYQDGNLRTHLKGNVSFVVVYDNNAGTIFRLK